MAFKKRILAATAAIAMLASGTSVAYADNTYVSGDLNTSGALVRYDYTRTHTFNGPFTETLQWNAEGTKSWDDILKGTRFAFQGRMKECRWFCDNTWGGSLTY